MTPEAWLFQNEITYFPSDLFSASVDRPTAGLDLCRRLVRGPDYGLLHAYGLRESTTTEDHLSQPSPSVFTLQILGHLGLEDGLGIFLPSNLEPLDWTALASPNARSRLDLRSAYSLSAMRMMR